MSERRGLRSMLTLSALLRLGVAIAAAVGLYLALDAWIGERTAVTVSLPGVDRPIDLLAPHWLFLVCVVPAFYLLRVLSLTDLSLAQQILQATLRSLVITAVAFALARPSWITQQSKVSTILLVDVSDSVSEKQLEAAKRYVEQYEQTRGEGNLQLVTFAEKPRVVRAENGPLSAAIKRHVGAGAGTDTQAAMQLAYGLYPDGYLPRLVIISDGNQTAGDVAVEAYRAKELGVKVSWRTFEQDKTSEIRVVGLTAPDDLKVGQPYEVTAEVWSTESQKATLTLQQDEFPNPLEPSKSVELREGKNLVKFKSDAKRAGATT
ncbi:MAG TPA: vWA domain-containing protein, partial [Kofleriaceae bacterium]|nr:vWA domain-containing protein [Kofleriaceae bacterium]